MGGQIPCSRICIRYFAVEVVLNTTQCVLISGCRPWVLCTIDPVSGSPTKWSRIHRGLLWLDGCLWETTHQVDLTVTHTSPSQDGGCLMSSDKLKTFLADKANIPEKCFLKLWHYVCMWIACCLSHSGQKTFSHLLVWLLLSSNNRHHQHVASAGHPSICKRSDGQVPLCS